MYRLVFFGICSLECGFSVGLVDIKRGRACVVLFGPETRPLQTKKEMERDRQAWRRIHTCEKCISYLPTLAHEWGNGQKLVNIADMGQMGLVNWVVGGVGSSPNFWGKRLPFSFH